MYFIFLVFGDWVWRVVWLGVEGGLIGCGGWFNWVWMLSGCCCLVCGIVWRLSVTSRYSTILTLLSMTFSNPWLWNIHHLENSRHGPIISSRIDEMPTVSRRKKRNRKLPGARETSKQTKWGYFKMPPPTSFQASALWHIKMKLCQCYFIFFVSYRFVNFVR